MGSIASPITTAGKSIEIRLNDCDASAGFESVANDNEVTLRFEPPGAGPDTDYVVSSGVSVSDCAGGRCKVLTFTAPEDLPALYPPDGLAGPARIVVRDAGNAVVGEIGELFLPTTGCDRTPEQVFQQFTVLPEPNNFLDASTGVATELRATLDGGGNLLVPFDYWGEGMKSVLAENPGSPVARILDGSITLDAFSGAPGIPIVLPSSGFIRSFTLDGRPLPPLLRSNTAGDFIFGSADATESVLRVARNMGGPDLYDLTDRLSDGGRGPIIIDDFDVSVRTPAPIRGLRAGTQVVAFARDEGKEGDINFDGDTSDRVVQIIDGQTGTQTQTDAVVVETKTANFTIPAMDTQGDQVAFLEIDPLFEDYDVPSNAPNVLGQLQVRLADGAIKTLGAIKGDPAPAIQGRPLRLSNDLVFMLQRDPALGLKFQQTYQLGGYTVGAGISSGGNFYYAVKFSPASVAVFERNLATGDFTLVQELFNGQGGIFGIEGASGGLTFDSRNVYIAGGTDDGLAVFTVDQETGLLAFLEGHLDGVSGDDGLDGARFPFVSADGKNLYVCGADEGKLAVFQRDTSTGALTFLETHADPGLDRCTTAIPTNDGQFVYASAGLGAVNAGAVTVYSRDTVTGALTWIETHEDVQAGGVIDGLSQAVATTISADGENAYVGGLGDSAITVFDRDPLTGELTYLDALFDGVDGVDGLASVNGVFPDPDNVHMYALGALDNTLNVLERDSLTGEIAIVEQHVNGVDGVAGLSQPRFGGFEPSFRELFVSSVVDGAIFRMPTVLRVFDVVSEGLRVFPETLASSAAVAGGSAILLTPESDDPGVTNGDLDRLDDIAQIYDGDANSVISLGTASHSIAISADLAALTNPETNTLHVYPLSGGVVPPPSVGSVDDGPIAATGTNVVFTLGGAGARGLRVYDAAIATTYDLQRIVDDFVSGDAMVAFRTPESPGNDLNGDGDTSDSVMQVYDFVTKTITSTGQAASLCTFGGCDPFVPYAVRGKTVSFVTPEQDQGSRDLNGDGDATDTVMQVFDATSRVVYVVDLSASSPDLTPFPEPFGDGTISYVQADEAALGIDVDEDGSQDDTVVLLAADSDDDGVFDDVDLCRDDPAEAGNDTDIDGLGDGCDPTPICSEFTPIAPEIDQASAECHVAVSKAASVYTKKRGQAARKCLDSLARAKLAGEPGGLCLGGKVGQAAAAPSETKTAKKVVKADAKLRIAVANGCGGTLPAGVEACDTTASGASECVAATIAQAVERSLHQAYGELGASTPPGSFRCQKALGSASVKYLANVTKAMLTCLGKVADGVLVGDPQALCLGALTVGGTVDPPADPTTALAVSEAEATLQTVITSACPGALLTTLDACGANTADVSECLVCTLWRHAIEIVRAGYGPQP